MHYRTADSICFKRGVESHSTNRVPFCTRELNAIKLSSLIGVFTHFNLMINEKSFKVSSFVADLVKQRLFTEQLIITIKYHQYHVRIYNDYRVT